MDLSAQPCTLVTIRTSPSCPSCPYALCVLQGHAMASELPPDPTRARLSFGCLVSGVSGRKRAHNTNAKPDVSASPFFDTLSRPPTIISVTNPLACCCIATWNVLPPGGGQRSRFAVRHTAGVSPLPSKDQSPLDQGRAARCDAMMTMTMCVVRPSRPRARTLRRRFVQSTCQCLPVLPVCQARTSPQSKHTNPVAESACLGMRS